MAKSPLKTIDAPVEVIDAVFFQDMALAVYREVKSVAGTVAIRGYRPFLMWGLTMALVALGWAFVYRFAAGTTTANDLVALAGVVLPLMQQLFQRHREVLEQRSGSEAGVGMGPGAAVGA